MVVLSSLPLFSSLFSSPQQPRQDDPTPAPGDYAGQVVVPPPARSGPILRGRTNVRHDTAGPGPAAYRVSGDLDPGPAFSMGQRRRSPGDDAAAASAQPGPADYHVAAPRGREGPVLRGRPKEPKPFAHEVPGPNAYGHVAPPRAHVAAARLVPRYTDQTGAQQHDSGPGPNAYHVVDPRVQVTGGAPVLGAKWTVAKTDPTPGPNAYRAVLPASHAPAAVLVGRKADKKADPTPGPNAYRAHKPASHIPAAIIGGRHDEGDGENDPSAGPGPGKYSHAGDDIAQRAQRHGVAMTFKHVPKSVGEPTPGPASYTTAVMERGPAATLGGRWKEAKPDELPGPDAYHPENVLAASQFACKLFFLKKGSKEC